MSIFEVLAHALALVLETVFSQLCDTERSTESDDSTAEQTETTRSQYRN